MPTCPSCGTRNPRENTTCRKCGAVLGTEDALRVAPPQEPTAAEEQPPTEEQPPAEESEQAPVSVTLAELDLPRLALFAGVAVVVLGVIWYLAEHFSGMPLAYIGLPAGWIIGQALYYGARGKRGRVLQWIGLGLTLALYVVVELAVVSTTAVPGVEDGDLFQKLATWVQRDTLGLFFLIIGLWQAYSVPAPRRPARRQEESAEAEAAEAGETRAGGSEGGEPGAEAVAAEEAAPQETYLSCVRCKGKVLENEAWIIPGRGRSGPVVICPNCGNELESQFEAETQNPNLTRAALFGLGATIVAGVIWYVAEHFARMSLGFIAWAGAWGIAEAIRRGAGRKRGRPLQLMAVGFTLLLILGTQAAVLWPGQPVSQTDPALSPSGHAFAFVSTGEGNPDIYLQTAEGASFRLTTDPAADSQPAWSPDEAYLAFVSQRDGNNEIYRAEVSTATLQSGNVPQKRLTNNPADDRHPTWSSDGQHIAFESNRDGDGDLYVMRFDGSEVISLTNNAAYDGQPAWAGDGRRIAFVSDRDGSRAIYVLTISGTTALTTTATRAQGESPAWSLNAQRIAFVSGGDIYVMNADGSGQTRLTTSPADDRLPTWVLAGEGTQQILFVSDRDGRPEIYSMGADGTAQTCQTCEPSDVFQAFVQRMGDLFTPLLYLLALWQAWNSGAPRRLIGVQKPQPQG